MTTPANRPNDDLPEAVAIARALGHERGRRLLHLLGVQSAVRAFDRAVATDLAVAMLERGEAVGTIVERLVQRGFSRRTAYRIRHDALTILCQTGHRRGTKIDQDGGESKTSQETRNAI